MHYLNSVIELRCLITAAIDFFEAIKCNPAAFQVIVDDLRVREKLALLKEFIEIGGIRRWVCLVGHMTRWY